MQFTPAQQTAAAYSYFTLDEWKKIAEAIKANPSLSEGEKISLLIKLPSAVL